MNKFLAAAAIAAISAAASSNAAFASDVSIRYLGELGTAEAQSFTDAANAQPAKVKAVQAEVRADASARAAVKANGVNVANIIGKVKALDGSTVYIVR